MTHITVDVLITYCSSGYRRRWPHSSRCTAAPQPQPAASEPSGQGDNVSVMIITLNIFFSNFKHLAVAVPVVVEVLDHHSKLREEGLPLVLGHVLDKLHQRIALQSRR